MHITNTDDTTNHFMSLAIVDVHGQLIDTHYYTQEDLDHLGGDESLLVHQWMLVQAELNGRFAIAPELYLTADDEGVYIYGKPIMSEHKEVIIRDYCKDFDLFYKAEL